MRKTTRFLLILFVALILATVVPNAVPARAQDQPQNVASTQLLMPLVAYPTLDLGDEIVWIGSTPVVRFTGITSNNNCSELTLWYYDDWYRGAANWQKQNVEFLQEADHIDGVLNLLWMIGEPSKWWPDHYMLVC